MSDSIYDLHPEDFSELLREIPDCPKKLRIRGSLPHPDNKVLVVVGSRKYSEYGKEMSENIIRGLAGYPVTILSGLAIGHDSIAHRAALKAGIQTVAILGSGLSRIYPSTHADLAEEIILAGGGIISEYPDDFRATPWSFPRRNRIVAGMSHAVLVIEAEKISGTLITSRLATEYNREVGAVPGPVTSFTSTGPHMLIQMGAALIQNSGDVLTLFNLD
ncbi:MAG: protecting protein DprA, processing protein [Parcubacteria group bacterium]|nr:protecting protein DprA, processing protein [Parcubacteria group bacterium]